MTGQHLLRVFGRIKVLRLINIGQGIDCSRKCLVNSEVKMWRSGTCISSIADKSKGVPQSDPHSGSRDNTVKMGVVERESALPVPKPYLLSSQTSVPCTGYSSLGSCDHGCSPGSKDVDTFMASPSSIANSTPETLDSLISFGGYRE